MIGRRSIQTLRQTPREPDMHSAWNFVADFGADFAADFGADFAADFVADFDLIFRFMRFHNLVSCFDG